MNYPVHARAVPLHFHFNVQIHAADYVRLGPHLKSWEHLSALLVLNQFPLEDLQRLLVIELSMQCRQQVLTKLRSRIATAETKHVQQLIDHALPGKKT